MNILQKHFKKDYVHMRLWTRLYGMHPCPKKSVERVFFRHTAAATFSVDTGVFSCSIAPQGYQVTKC